MASLSIGKTGMAALLLGAASMAQAAPVPVSTASGGPFESILSADAASPSAADPKFRTLFASWSRADKGRSSAIAVPSQQPLSAFILTSTFGVRTDPFRGTFAMHPGIDMAAPYGTPVYATADGVIAHAGPSNGYGNLVEIDHGRGIHTRYGHLSSIAVAENMRVHRGELIGRVGSTGRSTGNHLHYEVRLDDRAINPLPFIQGAGYVVAMRGQTPAVPRVALASVIGATDAHAMGGPDD